MKWENKLEICKKCEKILLWRELERMIICEINHKTRITYANRDVPDDCPYKLEHMMSEL